jgi:hypothetical protein
MVSRMLDFTTGATPFAVKSPVTPAGCVAAWDGRRSRLPTGVPKQCPASHGVRPGFGGTLSTPGDRFRAVTDANEGEVLETYAAALQHDLVDLPAGTRTVGVVRRPTGWFHALVDENRPALGPPESLLSETRERREDLAARGLCDEEAHNAAWEAVDFAERYAEHVEESAEAGRALADLAQRVRAGEPVALVCFEGETKRCHRHALAAQLRERVGGPE